MAKPRIVTLLGTRPEIIKFSSLLPILDEEADHILVHSGQHYSPELDRVFFEELELKQPKINLGVGSMPPAAQVGKIMEAFEAQLFKLRPQAVAVLGDTNTGAAGALTVAKAGGPPIHLFHIESLLRCHNLRIPEEMNRVLIDRLADTLFSVNEGDIETARNEGIAEERVVCTGNTLADACLRMAGKIRDDEVLSRHGLKKQGFIFVTFHRQESVDSKEVLSQLVSALQALSKDIPIVFPVHPRTHAKLKEFGLQLGESANLRLLGPLGYRDTIGLVKNSLFCMTDSGGLLEESAILRVPALIVRNEVEQVYFIHAGIHRLVPPRSAEVLREAEVLLESPAELKKRSQVPLEIKTGVSRVIADQMLGILSKGAPSHG